MNTELAFDSALKMLIGKYCQGFVAGKSTGSMVDLAFGKSEKGAVEIHLYIEWASWRLIREDTILFDSKKAHSTTQQMCRELRRIKGSTVKGASLASESLRDLKLSFSSGIILRIYCDPKNPQDYPDYSLHTSAHAFVVGPRGRLTREKITRLPETPAVRAVKEHRSVGEEEHSQANTRIRATVED